MADLPTSVFKRSRQKSYDEQENILFDSTIYLYVEESSVEGKKKAERTMKERRKKGETRNGPAGVPAVIFSVA
jgi:hypothetical protein